MRIPRIYEPTAVAPDTIVDLSATAARHIVKVLRLDAGAPLELFDGQGSVFAARLETVRPARAYLEKRLDAETESPVKIALLQALSRGAKMDMVVQKAVELGAATIWPVFTERSVMRLDTDKADKKRAHWESIAISACEQCGRNHAPTVRTPAPLAEVLTSREPNTLHLLLEPTATSSLPDAPSPQNIRLLIGPEGGFSEAEREAAVAAGYQAIHFGPRVLRTETAAIAALSIVQHRWGDI